jgi:hypothetical protein
MVRLNARLLAAEERADRLHHDHSLIAAEQATVAWLRDAWGWSEADAEALMRQPLPAHVRAATEAEVDAALRSHR